jgi:hypothetical protein
MTKSAHVRSSQLIGHIELCGRGAVQNLEGGAIDIKRDGGVGGRSAICGGPDCAAERHAPDAESKDAVLFVSVWMLQKAVQYLLGRQAQND